MKGIYLIFIIFVSLNICCKNEKIAKDREGWDGGFVMSITPLADGGAYAEGFNGLWYLKNNFAVKVIEKDTVLKIYEDSLKTNLEKYLWVQLQIEKNKRKECEEMLQEEKSKNDE